MSNPYAPDVVSPYYMWMGQVVDSDHWHPNMNPKIHDRDDIPGFGFRYKCRIFGRDLESKEHVSDDQLDWAEAVLPITAGSGHGGSSESSGITQGAYVIGYYADGILATKPVITGIIPNHSQTALFGGDPDKNFVPRSGFKGSSNDACTAHVDPQGSPKPNCTATCESGEGNKNNVCIADQQADGARCHYVPKTKACDKSSGLKGIQLAIRNAIALINRIKSEVNSFVNAASDITSKISSVVSDLANFISKLVKTLIGKIRGYVINKINDLISKTVNLLPPNARNVLEKAGTAGNNTIECIFNKIIAGLYALVLKLLNQIIDKYINAPMCAIENFIGSILSNILGQITGAIQQVLSIIQGIVGQIGSIAGSIMSALDVVLGILNFLSCDEPLDCTMGDAWSFWKGASCAVENASSNLSKKLDGIIAGIAGTETPPPCNTDALPCGPPNISFSGGVGSGALANPVVSVTGAILALDLKSGGRYFSPPNINITDGCGIGGGAVAIPIMKKIGIGSTGAAGIGSTGETGISTATGSGGFTGIATTSFSGISTVVPFGGFAGIATTSFSGISTVTGSGGFDIATVNGVPVTAGGVGGTPITSGDVLITIPSGIPGGINNIPLTVGGSGGIPVAAEIVGGTGGTLITVNGNPITVGGTGGTPVTAGGVPVTVNGSPVFSGATGGIPLFAGQNIDTGNVETGELETIVGVIMVNSGVGYLPSPDGSLGGNGTIWAPVCSTIVKRSNGDYDTPYPPGKVIDLNPGDTLQYPGELPVGIVTAQSVTSPECANTSPIKGSDPTRSDGSYPVVLRLSDVAIANRGINYKPTDKITITPDHGVVLEPKYDTQGRLSDVLVVNTGIGFTDYPTIEINSTEGINAKIIPIFDVIRIGDLPEDQDIVPPGTNIINVVDCVGRVN